MEFNHIHTTKHKIVSNKEREEVHKSDFNMQVPSGYFTSSKKIILDKTIHKRRKVKVLQVSLFSSVAASLLVAILLFSSKNEAKSTFAINEVENKILINALFIDDNDIERLADAYMLEHIDLENELLN